MRTTRAVLGTMNFGDGLDESAATAVLESALDAGVVDVDTANGYAGGESERMLGRILTARRDEVSLATKAGMPHPDAEGAPPLSALAISRCVEGSLSRLRTDRINLFYLHQPDRSTSIGETLDAVSGLLQSGRIGSWGVSNYASWQLAELIFEARARDMPGPVVSQQMYNVLCRRVESEFIEAATRFAAPVIAYNPLAGGLLTGSHRFDRAPQGGRFGGERLGRMYTDRYWDPRMFDAVNALRAVSDEAGMPMIELALRWLTGRRGVAGVLVGGSRQEQIVHNLDMLARGPLEPELSARVDEVGDEIAGPVPDYHR